MSSSFIVEEYVLGLVCKILLHNGKMFRLVIAVDRGRNNIETVPYDRLQSVRHFKLDNATPMLSICLILWLGV